MNTNANDVAARASANAIAAMQAFEPPSIELNLSDIKALMIRGLEVALVMAGEEDRYVDLAIQYTCAELNNRCAEALLSPRPGLLSTAPIANAERPYRSSRRDAARPHEPPVARLDRRRLCEALQ